MQIEISPTAEKRLATVAAAAGYEDVQGYVAKHLLVLADQVTADQLPELTSGELESSLRQCDRAMDEAQAGKGRDFRAALDDIAARNGLDAT